MRSKVGGTGDIGTLNSIKIRLNLIIVFLDECLIERMLGVVRFI